MPLTYEQAGIELATQSWKVNCHENRRILVDNFGDYKGTRNTIIHCFIRLRNIRCQACFVARHLRYVI